MGNQSSQSVFILLGLSDLTDSRISLFLLILLVYVATLAANLLIVFLVISDTHLQTPMYFFLVNLSFLDIFNSSISISHVFFDIFTGNRLILFSTCISQVFFFSWFLSTGSLMLEIMSYDRYAAICHPLRYASMMSFDLCIQVVLFFWVLSFVCSSLHTLCALRLAFPDPTIVPGLFCEIYQLIQLSCSDTFLNYLLLYCNCAGFGVTGFFITLLSYVYIFKTVLNIKVKDGRQKAYSTCSSHLTVVFIFYGAGLFNYFQPKTEDHLAGRLMSLFYTVVTPLLNPLIYSLRNGDLKRSLQKSLSRRSTMP
ncbi:olfactory receptor 1f45-like [Aquarana catesbeiana]|uniref:olfactory receptor 1f45-like n=1 Tax=Aquarana catesbeiana TaxID=8400 RepID=UPI003CCA4649